MYVDAHVAAVHVEVQRKPAGVSVVFMSCHMRSFAYHYTLNLLQVVNVFFICGFHC